MVAGAKNGEVGGGFAATPVMPRKSRNASSIPSSLPQSVQSALTNEHAASSGAPAIPTGSHLVCAISENLAREVCIVSLDAVRPTKISITKQSNSLSFNETLIALDTIQPDEILLNEGRKSSVLAKKVYDFFHGAAANNEDAPTEYSMSHSTVVKFISRGCFEQTKGAELLRRAARKSTYNPEILDDFIVTASANAVMTYTTSCLGAHFAPGCLTVELDSAINGRMTIDRSTIANLEILSNARSTKSKCSLISAIDNTVTSAGSHLLRANLIAPSTSKATIDARLDLLDSFLEDEGFFYQVLESLERLPDLEKTLAGLTLSPANVHKENVKLSHTTRGIASLVCLKTTLQLIPGICKSLEANLERSSMAEEAGKNSKADEDDLSDADSAADNNTLANAVLAALSSESLEEILQVIEQVFTESTAYSKNSHAMRHQECFALRPSTDGMMDVLRKAFLANVDDIYALADALAKDCDISVKVKENTKRGYFLQIPVDYAHILPPQVIQPVKSGKHVQCTTDEVFSLNARAQENVRDLLYLTHVRIQETLDFARDRFDALASMIDAIALLDMCHSFADCVASNTSVWCRPVVSDGGNLAIREGRYAINTALDYVPNDTFAGPLSNFTLISGINGGGKSTYLKQIGLIAVLSQIGSYVPAEEAFIPLRDTICTRIGTGDDFEHNMSSFMLEMKETGYICDSVMNKKTRSLVLIDELGRATSNEDGVAIAWAVAEHLLNSASALTFFVTHYTGLSKLREMYGNVTNLTFGRVEETADKVSFVYDHKVVVGSCQIASSYGIDMAESCGWSKDVVTKARGIRASIMSRMKGDGSVRLDFGYDEDQAKAMEDKNEILKRLCMLEQEGSSVSDDDAREWLVATYEKFVGGGDGCRELLLRILDHEEENCEKNTEENTEKE
jgi:DNA mismatch repair protein MSH4